MKKQIAPKKIMKTIIDYCVIFAGVAICVCGLNFFLLPAKIAPGGFSGIGTLLYHTIGIPVGITVFALNVPLFLLAMKRLGKKFAARTLFAIFTYSLLADLLPVISVSEDGIICSVFGGALMGVGTGLLLLFGATTGGSDLLAKLISDKIRHISIGMCLFFVDFAIVAASGIVFDLEAALYATISIFVMSRLITLVTEGFSDAKVFLIITKKSQSVKTAIYKKLRRGVSEIETKGGFTGDSITALLCVVERSAEVVALKDIVKAEDLAAFVILWDTREVFGEGFKAKTS